MTANDKSTAATRHSIRQELYGELLKDEYKVFYRHDIYRLRDEEEREFKEPTFLSNSEKRRHEALTNPVPKIALDQKNDEQSEELTEEQRDELMKGAPAHGIGKSEIVLEQRDTELNSIEDEELNMMPGASLSPHELRAKHKNEESDARWHAKKEAERSEGWYDDRNKHLAEIELLNEEAEELTAKFDMALATANAKTIITDDQEKELKGLRDHVKKLEEALQGSRLLCAKRATALKEGRAAHISDMAAAMPFIEDSLNTKNGTKEIMFGLLPAGAAFTFVGLSYLLIHGNMGRQGLSENGAYETIHWDTIVTQVL